MKAYFAVESIGPVSEARMDDEGWIYVYDGVDTVVLSPHEASDLLVFIVKNQWKLNAQKEEG